ncbi:MAG: hypothetical protein K1X78_24525 [Verrucomicrobiaceae bacterium]|nr:hypothetical protein [Verrucomicrobiaceae bacterium]
MNSMDDRWKNCTRAGRGSPEEAAPPVPPGFAVRAMRAAHASGENTTLDLWSVLSRRALAFAAAVIMLAGSLLWWQDTQDALASPALADDAMQQVLWQP